MFSRQVSGKMSFSQEDLTKFEDTVAKTDQTGKEIEFEVRFGLFNGKTFVPGVDLRTFNRLKTLLSVRASFSRTRDDIYADTPGRFTALFNGDNLVKVYHTVKEIKAKFDYPTYGIRVSIGEEKIDELTRPQKDLILVREKKRWSTLVKGFRFDLTEVRTHGNLRGLPSSLEYEVEIEASDPRSLTGLSELVFQFLREIQGTIQIYTIQEKFQVIADFNFNTGSSLGTPGVIDHRTLDQVRNMKLRDMVKGGLIPEKGERVLRYGIDIKADGTKKYLYFHSAGIFIIQAPESVMKISGLSLPHYHGTIIQGELISKVTDSAPKKIKEAKIYMLLYDCLSNDEVRKLSFVKRQVYVDMVIRLLSQQRGMVFEKKEFQAINTPKDFYRLTNQILDHQYSFYTDGLIIQPLDHPYDTTVQMIPLSERKLTQHADLLKWKPPRLLSIDLEIKRSDDGIELMVNKRQKRIPFHGSIEYPFNSKLDYETNSIIENALDGTIIEFSWNGSKLVPERTRDDKPHPNNEEIALDVWEDMHLPIDEETIRGKKWALVFRYHNRQKAALYQAIPSFQTLLSIGSGAGGDVRKWLKSGVQDVLAVEPSEENREELKRRLDSLQKIRYQIVPALGQETSLILSNLREFLNRQVDVLEYMLSLSFFFDSDESLTRILETAHWMVKPGGYLLAFTIDGRKVIDYFNDENNRQVRKENGQTILISRFRMIEFEMRIQEPGTLPIPQINEGTPPDPNYKVYIHIPGKIVQKQVEYLVNIPRLTASLARQCWTLSLERPANTETFLTPEEAIFTSFFVGLVYQKAS